MWFTLTRLKNLQQHDVCSIANYQKIKIFCTAVNIYIRHIAVYGSFAHVYIKINLINTAPTI